MSCSKLKKIRGFNKKLKYIQNWRNEYVNLNVESLLDNEYEYVKLWVTPFNELRYKERDYIGPTRKVRIEIVSSLINIYDNWRQELDKLNKPYYLKIWLYEPRITSSQVVCAIGDKIEYYNNLFETEAKGTEFPIERYNSINSKFMEFNKKAFLDEEIIEDDNWPIEKWQNEEDYYWNKRFYNELEQKGYRKEVKQEGAYPPTTTYFIPKGTIWVMENYRTIE